MSQRLIHLVTEMEDIRRQIAKRQAEIAMLEPELVRTERDYADEICRIRSLGAKGDEGAAE